MDTKEFVKKKEQHTMQWMKYKMNYVTIDVIIGFNQNFIFYDNCKYRLKTVRCVYDGFMLHSLEGT